MAFPSKTNYLSGDVLTAAQMNDIGSEINALNGSVGKNKIINGDFRINQRAFSSTTTSGTYMFDRWLSRTSGDGTGTFSAQIFTPGTAPVAGYEGANYIRVVTAGSTSATTLMALRQNIESVRTFANQTITLSFWARANSGTPKVWMSAVQNFGTGGSPSASVETIANSTVTLSTSWTRYSVNIVMPSISGKTLGTNGNDLVLIQMVVSAGTDFVAPNAAIGIQNNTFEFWGIQAEAGNVATAFQTATGTLQGELAACQRYYQRSAAAQFGFIGGTSYAVSTSSILMPFPNKATMRVVPTSVDYSGISVSPDGINTGISVTSIAIASNTKDPDSVILGLSVSGATQYRPYNVYVSGATGYIGVSAEL